MALNNVNFVGRVAREPELRYTQSGQAVLRTSVAVARNYKDNNGDTPADFIPVIIWGVKPDFKNGYCPAESFADNVQVGDMLSFKGRLESGSYEDENNNIRYTLDVNVDEYGYIMKKQANENQQQNNQQNNRNNNNNRSNNRSNNRNNRK